MLIKFLKLLNTLGSGAALYYLYSYISTFLFLSYTLVVLTGNALLRIVYLIIGRYIKVLYNRKET
jgi:hypothetical protein